MDALDGNAIGGLLIEVFGAELTAESGACGHCGAVAQVAELLVYLEAPGTVGRCRTCESVVMVITEIRGIKCVDLRNLAMVEGETP